MKNKKLIRFVESLILLPLTTISSVPVGPVTGAALDIVQSSLAPQTVLSQQLNNVGGIPAFNNSQEPKTLDLESKAEAINAYFRERGMPMEGLGKKMVIEAEKNGLDWRLLPAIAVRESTGGKFACKKADYSAFGWGSCKINFTSHEHGIEIVAKNLGGNNPNTARHYSDKTTLEILRAYNPPSIVPRYAEQVIGIMDKIGAPDTVLALNS